ncbi:MAG: phosphate regulon transcriptional regulator PhoB [Rhodoferax sp.]|nr:phosphate regulon transcriptional regulator PhoB [Rhodoferax sp.]
MNKLPTVLVVEDEPGIAELIAVNLRHNGFRTTWAMDSASAERAIAAAVPDLIVLDWMLPGESGLVLAKRWQSQGRTKDIPLIMLTARGDEADRVAGLDAGADDYISKPFSTRELLARVRAVLRRSAALAVGEPLRVAALCLDPATYRVTHADQLLKLGPTEFRLLQFFMQGVERVYSRAQLLDTVWGDQVYIEERTVDVHVKRLRQALGAAGPMLETVRGAGYRLTATAPLHAHGAPYPHPLATTAPPPAPATP